MSEQHISYKIMFCIFGTIIVGILGYFGSSYMTKLNQIQIDLHKLQLEVTKIQVQILTRDEVKSMIRDEVEKHYYKELKK